MADAALRSGPGARSGAGLVRGAPPVDARRRVRRRRHRRRAAEIRARVPLRRELRPQVRGRAKSKHAVHRLSEVGRSRRYGLTSKKVGELGGREILSLPELVANDFEWAAKGPIRARPQPNCRVVFELYDDVAPLAVENFSALCRGDRGTDKGSGVPLTYSAVRIFRERVAATPRPRRRYSVETRRGDAVAATWIFSGGEWRRRRRRDVDIPWRRVAATPRPRRGYSVETRRGDAVAMWIRGGESMPRPRRGYSVETRRGAAAAAT